jgi:hypothetical protein
MIVWTVRESDKRVSLVLQHYFERKTGHNFAAQDTRKVMLSY